MKERTGNIERWYQVTGKKPLEIIDEIYNKRKKLFAKQRRDFKKLFCIEKANFVYSEDSFYASQVKTVGIWADTHRQLCDEHKALFKQVHDENYYVLLRSTKKLESSLAYTTAASILGADTSGTSLHEFLDYVGAKAYEEAPGKVIGFSLVAYSSLSSIDTSKPIFFRRKIQDGPFKGCKEVLGSVVQKFVDSPEA